MTSSGVSQPTAVDSLDVRSLPCGGLASEDQGHDAARGVLVDPSELVHLDVDARLLQDLALNARLRGLVEFEHTAGELPSAVVSTADRQESPVLAHDHSGYGHGVERR